MTLGSTQTLTEISTKNLPGGKGRPAREINNVTAICEPIFYKIWEPRRLTTLWDFTTCYGIALPYICQLTQLISKSVSNFVIQLMNKRT
jgi:hypothetical protein